MDAIATPGAQKVVIKRTKNNQTRYYAFTPTVSECGAPLFTTSITF